MNKFEKSVIEIAGVIGVKRQTTHNWKKLLKQPNGQEILLLEPPKSTRKPSFDIDELQAYIEQNPFAFDKEIGLIFGKGKSTIHKWRKRLNFKRKKAKTTYKEAASELKKI